MKAKLGRKNARAWKWTPFTNPARTDGAVFYHWRRSADEGKDYPFAKFNKVSTRQCAYLVADIKCTVYYYCALWVIAWFYCFIYTTHYIIYY